MREKAPAVRDFREVAAHRGFRVAVLGYEGVFREVVREACGRFKKKRQVVLNAGRREPFPHVLVDGALVGVARERFAPRRAKARLRFLVHREFVPREDADFVDRVRGALRLRVKAADFLDFVVKEVQAEGRIGAHREDVHDAAPDAEFARRHHLLDVAVARGDEIGL